MKKSPSFANIHNQSGPEYDAARKTMQKRLTVTVPITNLYWKSYVAFFKEHGCKIEYTAEKDNLNNRDLLRIIFPEGTQKQPFLIEGTIPCFKLILPDGTQIEEIQVGGTFYSFLYVADINTKSRGSNSNDE